MAARLYLYDNKEFSSIKKLSQYTGIHEKTLTARLRKGMPVEAACEKTDFRCTYYGDENEKKSLSEICREQSKNPALVSNRIKYGYSLSKALNNPKKISRQGIPIVVNGILYNSIAEALRKMNLTEKESMVRRRLKEGVKPDVAFKRED